MGPKDARYITIIAEEKNLSKAADLLFVSQSALSHALNKIESELGTRLFDRTKTPLRITDAGNVYIKNARQILLAENNIKQEIREIIESERGTVTLGLTSLAQRCYLPLVFPHIQEKFPHFQIIIKVGTLAELEYMLDHELIDFAVMVSADSNKYNYISLLNYNLVLVAPSKKRFNNILGSFCIKDISTLPEIPFSSLSQEDFITMTRGQQLYDICMNLFNNYNFIPHIILECNSIETIYEIILHGCGISLLPDIMIKRFVQSPDIQYFRIKEENLGRTLSLTYKKGKYLPKIAKEFILKNNI